MDVEDTNQNNVKICSKCGEEKPSNRIIKNRKICKDCCNKKIKERQQINLQNLDTYIDKTCKICNVVKNITLFSRNCLSLICIDFRGLAAITVCNQRKRINIYNDDIDEIFRPVVCQASRCDNSSDLRILKIGQNNT